jgi:hypothetical protein
MARAYILLSEMPQTVLGIECALCQRRERFDVEALKERYGGDVKMPDLLGLLVEDCPRQRAQRQEFIVHDRCRRCMISRAVKVVVRGRTSLYADVSSPINTYPRSVLAFTNNFKKQNCCLIRCSLPDR